MKSVHDSKVVTSHRSLTFQPITCPETWKKLLFYNLMVDLYILYLFYIYIYFIFMLYLYICFMMSFI